MALKLRNQIVLYMFRTNRLLLGGVIAFVVLIASYWFFNQKSVARDQRALVEFKSYITGYTGGVISRESSIRIRFATEIASPESFNQEIDKKLFDFSPSIDGYAVWVDAQTIEFRPNEALKSGKKYTASFALSKILNVPKGFETFDFGFETVRQSMDVRIVNLEYPNRSDLSKLNLAGILYTADMAENEAVEKTLTISSYDNTAIKWKHTDGKTHAFSIEGITREQNEKTITIKYDGSAIDAEQKDEIQYTIPAINDFSILSAQAVHGEEQYVEIIFSDPLMANQNLDGLITISDVPDLQSIIESNIIKVYPAVRQTNTKTLNVGDAIKNSNGKRLGKVYTYEVDFQEPKPDLKWSGKGEIIPSTDGLVVPFEAVSLKAIDIKISKIFENNINQFFQNNNFGQNYSVSEMYRVGRPILHKTIPITNANKSDYAKLKRYHIDLSDIIATESGAIYQIEMSYKKEYALFSCEGSTPDFTPILIKEHELPENSNSYEYEYYGDYYYDDDYDYSQRENPCNSAYYSSYKTTVKKLLFASDLGIVVKKGKSGEMLVAVTDVKTTEPISGADVEVFDFQNQSITKTQTDGKGWAEVSLSRNPYLLIVKKDRQSGYVRLDDANALPLTTFDVSGSDVPKGLKGYIYGERGVWRPGDTLFLSFMLEDRSGKIPANHPVVLELENPLGQHVKQMVSSQAVNGIYTFKPVIAADAPTGRWNAKVKVGGSLFSLPLRVETIMPNRLKIRMSLDESKPWDASTPINTKINVQWLHGAVANSLPIEVKLFLNKTETKFKSAPDYVFDDVTKSFESEPIDVLNQNLAGDGSVDLNYNLNMNDMAASGMLKATFKVKVSEEGGASSTDFFTYNVSPFNSYVGLKPIMDGKNPKILITDEAHAMPVITVDKDGKLVNRQVEIKMYKMDWRWWFDNADNDFTYFNDNYRETVLSKTIQTTNGKGTFSFKINQPEWGRYLIRAIDKTSGHSTSTVVYIDWPGYGATSTQANGASILRMAAEKEKYKTGEKAIIRVPAAEKSKLLVTLENGSRVIDKFWIDANKGQNEVSFDVTEQMAPNVYVHISLLQPHAQTVNDLPIRMYGVVPIEVENPSSILKPMIETASEFRPEEKITVKIKEENGAKMTYTLAIVDEGLLDLTKFKTPAPFTYFYAKEALGVNTWDMYDYVLGAQTGKIERIVSIGGDAEIKGDEKNKVNRFKPVVKFIGPFELDKNDVNEHTLTLPNYVGAVRVMVVCKDKLAYGSAEKSVPVRKPLMVLATLPRVLGPEEEISVPINVFVMDKKIRNVQVNVKCLSGFENAAVENQNLVFESMGDKMAYVKLKVQKGEGVAKLRITATSGGESSFQEIEIPVRNPNLPISKTIEKALQPNDTWSYTFEQVGIPGSNTALVEVSNFASLQIGHRLQYLIQYPYGCVEQTVSSVFPQLVVKEMIEMQDSDKERIDMNIKAAIQRLSTFQTSGGGFAYWPGYSNPDEWGSSYAGHFILEAAKKGFSVPSSLQNGWLKHQTYLAQQWQPSSNDISGRDLMQAYRLYTLALAGKPETGAMNRLREQKNISVAAIWRLAGAYALIGQQEVANEMVKNLTTTVDYSKKQYAENHHYGSAMRDKAMILEVLALLKDPKMNQVAKDIAASLSSRTYFNTQETAYMLIAISKSMTETGKNTKLDFDYAYKGAKSVHATTDLPVASFKLLQQETEKAGAAAIIKNNSKGTLFAKIVLTGKPAAGNEEVINNNLTMQVRYTTKSGEALNVQTLEQGTSFMAEVTIGNPGLLGLYQNMALRQVFPSGWEISNTRLQEGLKELKSDVGDYTDIRDDRVYTFFELPANRSKTFRVKLTAAYLGKFYLPAVVSDAMYNGMVQAVFPGQWVEVVTKKNALVD